MATLRTILLSVLVLSATNAVDHADEPRNPGRDFSTSRQLARINFPLPDQEVFAQDLSLLRSVLAAKIRHPMRDDFPGGKAYNHELDGIFELLSVWPSEEFRQPLVDFFESSDVYVIESAGALLAFQDDSTRQIVKKRSGYERSGQAGCFCYSESIDQLLEEEPSARQAFQPLDTLLPPAKEGAQCPSWPEGMICMQAISQLQDESLSVRLQSWAWLAEQGIIAPMDAVRESWSRFTEEQKRYIASLEPEYIGAERLLAFYEEVNRTCSPSMQGELLARRVELGSKSAKAEAREILRRTLEQDDWESLLSEAPCKYASQAICGAPDPEDIPVFVRIRDARDEGISLSATQALCRIDHPDAITEVEKILLAPREYDFLVYMVVLPRQAHKHLKHRWLYLRAIAKALEQRTEFDFDYGLLIDTFYAMSGQNFGWNGVAQFGDVDKEAAQKAAKQCIEWYLKECPIRDN